ncbi:hypothetical protein F5146DRAFT_1226124 [Armillaria mellea]|nr:hypothetical protein F5146DRAFT_1226124 [Armillaria mellea]
MALRCLQCDYQYDTPHTRVVLDWLRDGARRNVVDYVQADSVYQTITEARAELRRYDSHIARPRATLTQVENERVGLQDFISYRETLLSPVRRVPIEVLTLIFARVLQERRCAPHKHLHDYSPPRSCLPPMEIHHLNSAFLMTARALPRPPFYVVFGNLFQRRVRERMKYLRLQLPRQGSSQRTALLYYRTEDSPYPLLESVELHSTGEQAATEEWYQELEVFCAPRASWGMDTRIHLWHLVLKDIIGRMWFIPEFLNHLTELEHLTLEITNQTYWTQSRSGVTPPGVLREVNVSFSCTRSESDWDASHQSAEGAVSCKSGESMLLASAELWIDAGRELRKETIEQVE